MGKSAERPLRFCIADVVQAKAGRSRQLLATRDGMLGNAASCCRPGTSAADPGITDDERRTIVEMMAKGTYAGILLATADLDGTFARMQASGAEVVHEPTEQLYGVRDCAFRDPAGNLIRINELR